MASVLLLTAAGCSTQKNTAMSRFSQAMLTRFNTYFNGEQAFEKGYREQENAVADNYLEILDLFPISNETAVKSGTGSFDIAIEKAQKCVTLHSIKAKPVKKDGSRRDKEWYNKNEYNPFLWHAWMLMADAQMQKGEFLEAASTYSYIGRLYADDASVVAESRMKMAMCYSELGWNYEADEVFSRMALDSIPATLRSDYSAIRASHLLKQKRYREAIPVLKQAMPGQRVSKSQKIREYYLLGQLYKETGDMEKSYSSFQKVIRRNPPYQVEFNARIQQTEAMPSTDAHKIEKKLRRMARNPNNKRYLDQVYYAIGNVFLACGDTLKALHEYETGLSECSERRPERGILLLTMASLYWDRADYSDAARCYSEAVGLVDQDNAKYDELMLRSSVLETLVRYTEEVELQDSLRHLSTLPDTTVVRIIDGIIEKLVAEEEEEARLAEQAEREAGMADGMSQKPVIESDEASWYFYNPALVKKGVSQFNRTWGRRKLEDHWRRSDKSASLEFDDETGDESLTEKSDSTASDSTAVSGQKTIAESDDPHTREYYLQQIPYTAEQFHESGERLSDALLQAGVIYKDELREYELSEKALRRSAEDFPEMESADDALYNLYLLYSLWKRNDMAEMSRESLKSQYPDSRYTLIVSDPYFEENVKYGKHREDSLYQVAYQYFRNGQMTELDECCRISEERYPAGSNRGKFIFLNATSRLYSGDIQGFLDGLKTVIEKYPEEQIAQLATIITQGVHDGKILQSSSFGSIWNRRVSMDGDSIQTDSIRPQFNADRMQPYIVVMAYPADSLNENQLLFETASYNFSRYMVRNFDMTFRHEQGIGMLVISEFLNFDEAYLYRQRLYADGDLASKLEGINTLIITKENLELLLRYYSFNEYQEFYDEQFLNIPEFDIDGMTIDEPDFEDDVEYE